MTEFKLAQATRLEAQRDFEGAITILKDLVRQDPTCVEAFIHLAADSGILGRFRQAELHARNAISLDPTSGGLDTILDARLGTRVALMRLPGNWNSRSFSQTEKQKNRAVWPEHSVGRFRFRWGGTSSKSHGIYRCFTPIDND